jgi:hypothetical protein
MHQMAVSVIAGTNP